jgi:Rieske 2Fe-2S family protein
MSTPHPLARFFEQHRPGFSLARDLYVDPAVHEFDIRAVFERNWLQACLESELPARGDYITLAVGESSIIVLRNADGEVAAFFNTCRHRGARICREPKGHAGRLICPYHHWSYDLRGRLTQAPRMQEGFDTGEYRLRPVRVEVVCGLVFICLSEQPPDFAPFRAALEPMLGPHELHKAKVAHVISYSEQADWKLVMENARECYHCRTGHPQLMRSFRDFTVKESSTPGWELEFNERCAQRGLKTGEVIADWYEIGRYALGENAFSYTMDGKPAVSKTLGQVGDGNVGAMWWGVQPNGFNHVVGDYGFFFQCWPTGPRETTVTGKWIVHEGAVEGVDYDLQRLIEVWHATNDQDRMLAENNQRGVNSSGYVPGPYSQVTEQLVLRFIDFYRACAESYLTGSGL